jgi:hypothetical protein
MTSDDILWNDSEEDRDVSGECEEDAGTDCEDGDRIRHSLCIKCRKLIAKYFFPSRCFIFGGDLDLDEYILLWQTFFFGELS